MTTDSKSQEKDSGYAALTGTFLVGAGAAIFGLERKGRLPERIEPSDLALLGIASYQLSRTLTRDRVTTFLRRPFADEQGPAGRGEVKSEPRGKGLQRAVGELMICPFCMTQWVAGAALAALCVAPRTTRFAASMLAVRTVAEAANIAHEAAVAEVDRMQKVSKLVPKPSKAA
jgi:Protein of unknown function (DUF1360)